MDNPNTYTDSRGTIKDLLVTPEYSITHITFNEGAVRGNHYHKQTKQVDFILKGLLTSNADGNVSTLNAGESIAYPANVRHAYKAVLPTEMLSICFGVRKGTDYEKDVIRLKDDEKLL